MPTRSGWLVALGAVLALVAGRLLGVVELYVLGAAGLLLDGIALVWVRRRIPPFSLERHVVPSHVVAGAPARIDLTIANLGGRMLPAITVIDPVEGTVGARIETAPLGPRARRTTGYRLPTTRRGPLRVGPLGAQVTDPFGLAVRPLPRGDELTVLVHPRVEPVGWAPSGRGSHEPLTGLAQRAVVTAGIDELVTLRPYVMGDDLRRVHWPSSAHADELLVRRDEERWQGHLSILLDVRAGALGEAPFERAVSAAAGFVHKVAERGDRIRLLSTAGLDTTMVDARRSRAALMEQLALVEPAPEGHLRSGEAHRRDPGLLVVLTGAADHAGTAALVDQLHRTGFPELLVVAFADAPRSELAALAPPPPPGGASMVVVARDERLADRWTARPVAGSAR